MITKDNTPPTINGSLNKSLSNIFQGDVINATFNATDDINLTNATITINDTGITRHFNFSLNGSGLITQQFSQNFTITCAADCVVSIIGIARDNSSNNARIEFIFKVGGRVKPIINGTLNKSLNNEYTPINTYKIDMPIRELIKKTMKYPNVKFRDVDNNFYDRPDKTVKDAF